MKTCVAALGALLALASACQLDKVFHEPPPPGGAIAPPDDLAQFGSDSVTPIPVGGSAAELSIVVRAIVPAADSADTLHLEVEARAVGTAFSGEATDQSGPRAGSGPMFVRVGGLEDGSAYHWRARVANGAGGASAWLAYGDNPEGVADLRVALPAAANRLTFVQQPTTTTAGATTMAPVEVSVVDGQGNVVTSFSGAVSVRLLNANGATLGGNPNDIPMQSGVATFSTLSMTQAGSNYRLEATTDGVTAATSASFAITAGPPDHLVFLQEPSDVALNQAITPAVRVAVHDVYSNVVTSFTDVMFMNIGNDGSLLKNATLDPAGTHRAASAGIATFEDLRIDQLGAGYTLAVSAAGTRGATSGPFNVTP